LADFARDRADRLPQSDRRAPVVDLQLYLLSAGLTPDHGRGSRSERARALAAPLRCRAGRPILRSTGPPARRAACKASLESSATVAAPSSSSGAQTSL